jgi:hypothetical protein
MRWAWLVLATVLLGGPADAQTLHALPTGLAWRSKPTAEDMATFYPPKAQRAEQAGWATLECLTATTGEMKACQLLGEAPAGFGFGAAGLKLAAKFRIDATKIDPAMLEGGVVTIPISMVTPTGTPMPPRDYLAGQPAALVTVATDRATGDFPCPTAAAPDRQCRARPFKWRKSPSLVESASAVRSAKAATGHSTLTCRVQTDYSLTGCGTRETDPQRTAAMLALAAMLVAPEQADDQTPTVGRSVAIDFNWPSLLKAVETSVLTNPRP